MINLKLVFTALRYAVTLCLSVSVCLSVCLSQVGVLLQPACGDTVAPVCVLIVLEVLISVVNST